MHQRRPRHSIHANTKQTMAKASLVGLTYRVDDTWTKRTAERKKVDVFEMWCWRRVMSVSCMEKKTNDTNAWVFENEKEKKTGNKMAIDTRTTWRTADVASGRTRLDGTTRGLLQI